MRAPLRGGVLTVVAAVTMIVAAAAEGAGRPTCLVSNERTGLGSRSLQGGIDAATAGDLLVVKGLCVGTSTVLKDLTLKGVSNPAFGVATLDAQETGTVLKVGQFGNPVDVRVSGLTITNGRGPNGGGVYNENLGGTLTIVDSTVTGNTATSNGGGGIFNAGTLVVVDSIVSDNASTTNTFGGLGGGGIRNQMGMVELLRSSVTGNSANVDGGGIFSMGGTTLQATDSTIAGNTATGSGGGFEAWSSTAVLTRTSVVGNSAAGGGGISSGGFPSFPSSITLVDSVVADNRATASIGGGLRNLINGVVTISGSSIVGNSAVSSGGGIYNVGRTLNVSDSLIDGNHASQGGGLYNSDTTFLGQLFAGTATLTDVMFSDNAATSGGAIHNSGTLVTTNVTFSGNVPDDCVGGGCP